MQLERWSEEAFTSVFNEVYSDLSRYLECLVGRSGIAQEIAQETLLRLYRLGPNRVVAGEERFWVFRVATNLAFNELRRVRRSQRLIGRFLELFRTRERDPVALAEQTECDRRLLAALDRLPEHHRAALLLRERECLSYAEIGRALGVSLSKVKVDIFRARSALRSELAGDDDTAGIGSSSQRAERRGMQ